MTRSLFSFNLTRRRRRRRRKRTPTRSSPRPWSFTPGKKIAWSRAFNKNASKRGSLLWDWKSASWWHSSDFGQSFFKTEVPLLRVEPKVGQSQGKRRPPTPSFVVVAHCQDSHPLGPFQAWVVFYACLLPSQVFSLSPCFSLWGLFFLQLLYTKLPSELRECRAINGPFLSLRRGQSLKGSRRNLPKRGARLSTRPLFDDSHGVVLNCPLMSLFFAAFSGILLRVSQGINQTLVALIVLFDRQSLCVCRGKGLWFLGYKQPFLFLYMVNKSKSR